MSRASIVALSSIACVAVALGTSKAAQLPNVDLEVTVRQKQDGKLAKGLHVLDLVCWYGDCSLTILTLNQCFSGAFYPKIERASTKAGDLKVFDIGGALHVQQTGMNYTARYQFGYVSESPNMATRVTSFSGGYTKDSGILGRVFTAEYLPLQGRTQRVGFDCPALLPGVDPLEATS